ncbi:hypothetical protein [Roseateles toxinivorans]|uniref:Uncharacterized protein n=1 Tax=Roseateles toxinivorans TaxID=270368 RepID=A0A4R6QLX1_9BURK|nr:hypothetical protein [Roseateles toxinivorans]TDP71070.1 hypothetical protein DES47_10348 [Roseateles toxinivorans]
MSLAHAVVWLDHHNAQILHFDAEQVRSHRLKEQEHDTHQHGSGVRTEHEFFAAVCDALSDIGEVLVTAGHTAQSDFRRYVDKHRPAIGNLIVGWETVDHPSDAQLVARARQFFAQRDGRAVPVT